LLGAALGLASLECGQPEALKHGSVTTGHAGAGGPTGGGGATAGAAGDMGVAGDMGMAGSTAGAAGTMGLAGDMGMAGSAAGTVGTAGAAGSAAGTVGTAGAAGSTAGTMGTAGAAGSTAGTMGTAGAAGTTAGTMGTAGAAGTTAGTGGAAGNGTCMNSTVVTAGGMESLCTAKNTWKATAMPTPPSMLLGIMDIYLQPQYGIDSNTATRYSTGATMAAGMWYQVDLGAAKMVSGITVDTSEGVDGTDVADGYDVGLSMDGITFTTVATCAYNAAPMEVINFKAAMGRYVRYTNKGPPGPKNGPTSWMSIHEFDIRCN
jgi:hypothetical protein